MHHRYSIRRSLCLLAVITLFYTNSGAQQPCGTLNSPPPPAFVEAYQAFIGPLRTQVVDSIGIAVHLIDPGNTSVPTFLEIQDELDLVNGYFEGSGLCFFICDIKVIQGAALYSISDVALLNKAHYEDHRVNVYLMSKLIGATGNFLCGVSIFPWDGEPDQRFNAIGFDCFGDGQTLAHELGHFYGLLHTHDISNGRELVNRSNCWEAGDLICDTPADPALGFHNVSQCQYTGAAVDALGDIYIADATLIMSYTPAVCASRFSNQQLSLMRYYADEVNNTLVDRCSDLIDFQLTSPLKAMTTNFIGSEPIPLVISGGIAGENEHIDITYWISNDPNMRGELIKRRDVDLTGHDLPFEYSLIFKIPPGRDDGPHFLTIKLDADRRYMEQNERNNEVVIALTLVNSNLRDLVVFPNPAQGILNVFRRSTERPGKVAMQIHDLSGKLVKTYAFEGDYLQFYVQLDVAALEPGLYHLSMVSENHIAGFDDAFLFLKN